MSRWDSMLGRSQEGDYDSEEEGTGSGHKGKSRRKSHQRPQVCIVALRSCTHAAGPWLGPTVGCNRLPRHSGLQGNDQIRQAFSKRKKGLVLKAYQLNSLTDAKVRRH